MSFPGIEAFRVGPKTIKETMGTRLTHRDYGNLLASVQRIQSCRSLELFPHVVMQECRSCVPCDSISYNEMPLRAGHRLVAIAQPDNTSDPALQENWQKYFGQHPVLRYMRETGDGSAHRLSDFVNRRQLRRLELYQQFFRLHGVEHQIAFCLQFAGETVIGLGLNRAQRDFREHARSYLNLLRPHCAEAFSLACAWHALTGHALRLEDALATTDEGVLLYSDRGILLHATARARERLRRFFGWRGRRQLPASLREWIHAERARYRTPEKIEQVSAPLCREANQARLAVRLADRPEHHYCAVLLQEEATGVTPGQLAPLGLTPRESDALAWLVEGKSNAEIGIILGISRETARKHVQHVLDKLGAPNRTAAVRTALGMARPGG